ncbi:hemocytin [Pieris rapae]|uniref:hemocytin n=1 Tax=Pieris rapae TaxID=64459 RepID=UPI001E27B38F|nr:hemocytin [Pieris rapae]
MFLILHGFIFLCSLWISDAGYGIYSSEQNPQADVQAPAYIPAYLKNQQFSKTPYTRRYTGTKTVPRKTYSGTKTAGTKTAYGERRSWQSSGMAPNYKEFYGNANSAYTAKCDVECKNNGICIDTNTCLCPPNFDGKFCEFEKKPCLVYPPTPQNSIKKCSAEMCTIQCVKGHKFIDGTAVANLRCVNGHWQPTRADITSIPDCAPECDPPCVNGGVCLAVNTCQCPSEYRGPQCQYAATVCDIRKLAFNGGYSCFGDMEKFSCKLTCPTGASFSTPASELYTCLYSTGIFEPQPIPHCVFDEVVIITPSNHHYTDTYYSIYTPNATEVTTPHSVEGHPIIVVQDLTPKGGSCLTWAGTHYKTFDGKIYSFESPCQHILVRDSLDHKYTVAIRQPECKRRGYCPSEITIYLEDKMYALSIGEDNAVIFRNTKRLIPIPASLPGIRVDMPTDLIIVNLDLLGVTVKWDLNNLIIVEGTVSLWNKTEGLCGTLDSNPENDMTTKEGHIAKTKSVMIASWQLNKIGDICDGATKEMSACAEETDVAVKKAVQFCASIFSKDKFRKCSKVMDVSQLLEACQWDYCACTESLSAEECACRTVAVYAKECLRHGVEEMRAWRDSETCPMNCPAGKIYRSCGPDTQPSCAFPYAAPLNDSSCVEGCFCLEGFLLEGGKCVQKSECPCRARNQIFPPGAVVPKSCNTCTCQAGEWICTQTPCGARCGAVGDPHYTTFDGLRYDFMGHCTYTLLKADNLTIEVENVACLGSITEAMNLAPYKGEGKPSCTKAVSLSYKGANIHMKQGGFILVNGKEISSLPVTVGDIRIRAASSLFIIIQLPIKVDLWWDGNTRVFVDVPPTFTDKTAGLCGTFNLNQKDDFLTPEGDIEQTALAFANKWKTREFCDDTAIVEPEHPCKANVENKAAAEQYCAKLKTKLFESCHWYVDVEPYYEACVYDMCACDGDVSRCLCPILGDYAMVCAKAGIMIQWRYNVKECELQCTGGQEYTVCADSCLRTCSDLALSTTSQCKPCCVEGCACPPGQVLDNNNECVPTGLCPCYHKGMEFKSGYKEVRAGRRERELCTCVGAKWECVPATPADIEAYPPAEDLRSNCSSANNMDFTTCLVGQPLTCKNMHLPQSVTTEECRPGCQCKKGYVLESTTKKCVVPESCPCHHGGRSYPDGHTMQEECNTCTCESGKWACTKQQCSGVCTAWGDSHMITFDGSEFDFEGVCTYLLAKGVLDGQDGFSVEIQNVPCGTTGASCSKALTLKVGSGGASEEVVTLAKNTPLPDGKNLKRIKIRTAGAYTFLDVPSAGVSVQWDRGLRAYVKLDSMWRNRVKGLCGNYNGDTRDDFQTPSGGGLAETSPLLFADSWKLKATCPKAVEVTDHCKDRPHRKEWASSTCGVLKMYPFTMCHSEVPVSGFVSRCEADACACDSGGDCECACAAIATYAHACNARGVHVKWRHQELCPMQCDEECSNYNECISACPPETCDNTLDYAEIKAVCEQETCVEGCKANKTCPEGTVYSNSSLKECVPRSKCKPVCMTLPDGTEILEGEVIEQDTCHTCRCSKKVRVCTGQPCSTEATTPEPTSPPETTPHDEAFRCSDGWSEWINRGPSEIGPTGESKDVEPLPLPKEFLSGTPMCKRDNMTKIECRTVGDHKSPKETGLNVECSLEKGLVCSEREKTCPDFEIRVFCQCEEIFQCLDSTHPNHPHPTDCGKFYECIPNPGMPQPHAVLKDCPPGLMYHSTLMVCDWPAAVIADRPECGEETTVPSTKIATEPTTVRTTQATSSTESTTSICPPGQVYKECAYPCDKLCDHFKRALQDKGQCFIGEKCISGCVDQSVDNMKCEFGSLWRDEKTCVPVKDCTCQYEGKIIKPGGVVVVDDCTKCQCLDNELHCDSSDCVSIIVPIKGSTHSPMIFPESHKSPSTTTISTTTTSSTTTPATIPTVPSTSTKAPDTTPVPSTTETTTVFIRSTVTPPPKCNPDNYKNLLWEGTPLPASAFTASSAASPMFEPYFTQLDGRPSETSAGSWNPYPIDDKQYVQVELPEKTPVYGVVMQGSPLFNQYVTSYEVMYGDDGNVFSYVNSPSGKPQVFRGPVDHTSPLKQMFEKPFEAKFVRIHPLTWHEEIAVRFELIGCEEFTTTATTPTTVTTTPTTVPSTVSTPPTTVPSTVSTPPTPTSTTPTTSSSPTTIVLTTLAPTTPEPLQCTEPLGLAADLPIDMIEVSSNNDGRPNFKLEGIKGWKPAYSTPGEWIMFNLTSPRNITGIKTKGGPSGWVSAYNIMYTCDLSTFNPVVDENGKYKLFPGNFDADSVVMNEFRPSLRAQYLKVLPLKWNEAIEMRVEPIGCFEPYPLPEEARDERVPLPKPPCEMCPDVPVSSLSHKCACTPPYYFDGENCVPRDECPCMVGFMSYPVGSAFRGDKCDDCMCKLGGVTDCRPAADCICAPDLVPHLSPACECLCEPCANGTKICPTSKLCLPLEKWCDGLQDCPDDERDCTTRAPVTETVITTVLHTEANTPPTVTTPATTIATTEKPKECPKVECPPGYTVLHTSNTRSSYSRSTSDLPPPRPRYSYQRYYRGGFAKGGFSKGGFAKTGYSKGGFSKGGYGPPAPPRQNQAFSLDKPSPTNNTNKQECAQFKCIPALPPPFKPGSTPAPVVCSTPACPPHYTLKIESVPTEINRCPQYVCVPPPERPVFCNVTGRTFNTFDGMEYKFDVCFHILARENRFDAWTVLARKKCSVDQGCANELLVLQDDQLIVVKPNLMIEYDNYEYTVEQTSKICFQKNSFDVFRLGNGLAIQSRKYNFTVLYSTDGDVKIGVSKKYMGHVDGLCGAYDGDISNDRRLPNGRLAQTISEFGTAWAKPGLPRDACKTKVISPQKQKRVWDLCNVITQEPLSECAKVLPLDKWRSICLEKICECAEMVINGTKRTEEQCRCLLLEQMVAECLAADKNINVDTWRIQNDCPADCPPPLIHYDCYRKRCEPSCGPLSAVSDCPAEDGQCFPGCYCPPGKLRKADQCVAPHDCLDCVCTGVGTPAKYVTFEGDDLPFLGNCTYLASRDRNDTGQHKYQVYATNGPCEENSGAVCTKAVHLIYEKHVIHITKDPDSKKLITSVNGQQVFRYPLDNEWAEISLVYGQDISIIISDLHVELQVKQNKMEFTVQVPSYLYANKTEGLCGVCAGYQEHLLTSNGTVTDNFDTYGKSWQAVPDVLKTLEIPPQEQCGELPPTPECVSPPPESNPCYNIHNVDKFGACHALVDPQSYIESCEAELCDLNTTNACPTLERYAAECRKQGVCLDWRTDLCPYACENPLVYRACVDCERTCENHDELEKNPKKCDQAPVEGCFCPEGKVRINSTCIEPSKCFPCDSNSEHYAGDEWQEDACTKCTCSKVTGKNMAHVACTTQTCTVPVCSEQDDLVKMATKIGACCPEYMCVPKPKKPEIKCEEPKKMDCGFGQVLKQKTNSDGCQEFACECKPANECEEIPGENEVEMLEPGIERVIDRTGCCPKAQLVCRPNNCPKSPDCPKFHTLETINGTGQCCPEYKCELPKDKCLVTLEWEAASRGGEKPRTTAQVMLKEIDSSWLDGPCRSCRCVQSSTAHAQCSVTECPAIVSSEQFVVEARPVPFACCPRPVQTACRQGDVIFKVGESWKSPNNACESYQCKEVAGGNLEIVTTVQNCDSTCQLGWEYVAASVDGGECCGHCKPAACVVRGEIHNVSDTWTSPDFCSNFTCALVDNTLQVLSENEQCPEIPESMLKQYVLSDEKVPGKCCPKREPTACRVGNEIYQESQTWPTSDPCKNVTCSRDASGKLTQTEEVQSCDTQCKRGWAYKTPSKDKCCGHCAQEQCVVAGELKEPGSTWKSLDNCTTYTCEKLEEEVFVTSSRVQCPDLSACAPDDIVTEDCCQVCREKPKSQSKCVPEEVSAQDSVGLIRISNGLHGLCVNKEPLAGFRECRGSCDSGTVYNNQTGSHDSRCECCTASRYAPMAILLSCDDGTRLLHRVATPAECVCRQCGETTIYWPLHASPRPHLSTQGYKGRGGKEVVPDLYKRFGAEDY